MVVRLLPSQKSSTSKAKNANSLVSQNKKVARAEIELTKNNTRPRASRPLKEGTGIEEGLDPGDEQALASKAAAASAVSKAESKASKMDGISKKLGVLDSRRQDLAKQLDKAQKSSDYDDFQRLGNNYLGTILESIDLYIDLIREISSEPVAGELKNEFSEIVKRGKDRKEIEGQSDWISNDVSPLYEKVRQICACVYAAVAKIDQEANKIA
jgi:hypothetical protein